MIRTLVLAGFLLFGAHPALSFAAADAEQIASPQIVTLDVPGMTCSFCPITIRKALQKVDGVIEASADYDSKTATVTFDPSRTGVQALTEATAHAGYPSTVRN